MDAVARQDVRNTILVLAYCRQEHINTPYSKTDTRTALHIAAALGNLVLVQLLLWVRTLLTCISVAHFVLKCELLSSILITVSVSWLSETVQVSPLRRTLASSP